MSPQFGALGEALAAGLATEGRLSVVGLGVALQRAAVTEGFGAGGAPEGFLRRVDPHVRHHVSLLVEDFAADVAAEGFLSSVQPQVHLPGPHRGELPAADVAGSAPVAVRLEVEPQTVARLQLFTAQTTHTLRRLHVFLHVFHQKALPVEGLSAHPAAVRRRLHGAVLAGGLAGRRRVVRL